MSPQVAAPLAAVLTGLAVLALGHRTDSRRLAEALPPVAGTARPAVRPAPVRAAFVLAGVGVAVLVSGPPGLVLGLAVAAMGPELLGRLESREQRAEREQLAADLPLLLDLLSACLTGGAALSRAAEAVAAAVPGPAGRRLAAVGSALAVGTAPPEAWRLLAGAGATARGEAPRLPRRGCWRALLTAALRWLRRCHGWPPRQEQRPAPGVSRPHAGSVCSLSLRSACASCRPSSCSGWFRSSPG